MVDPARLLTVALSEVHGRPRTGCMSDTSPQQPLALWIYSCQWFFCICCTSHNPQRILLPLFTPSSFFPNKTPTFTAFSGEEFYRLLIQCVKGILVLIGLKPGTHQLWLMTWEFCHRKDKQQQSLSLSLMLLQIPNIFQHGQTFLRMRSLALLHYA